MKTQECTMGAIYEGMADEYINRQHPADREYLDRSELEELFRLPVDNETVLDVGCGVGRVGIALKDRGVKYIGVDLSEAMLQAGRKLAGNAHLFICASARNLPFAARRFRFVTCIGLYEYVEDLATYLNEVRRVMQAGGDFIFTAHTELGALRYNRLGSYHRAGWSEQALRAVLAESCFSVRTIRPAIGPLRRWRSIIGRITADPTVQKHVARLIADADLALCRSFPPCANEFVVACRATG
jgi:ubiquinone/menaquinone biosynthesis C-methylase UbiE